MIPLKRLSPILILGVFTMLNVVEKIETQPCDTAQRIRPIVAEAISLQIMATMEAFTERTNLSVFSHDAQFLDGFCQVWQRFGNATPSAEEAPSRQDLVYDIALFNAPLAAQTRRFFPSVSNLQVESWYLRKLALHTRYLMACVLPNTYGQAIEAMTTFGYLANQGWELTDLRGLPLDTCNGKPTPQTLLIFQKQPQGNVTNWPEEAVLLLQEQQGVELFNSAVTFKKSTWKQGHFLGDTADFDHRPLPENAIFPFCGKGLFSPYPWRFNDAIQSQVAQQIQAEQGAALSLTQD